MTEELKNKWLDLGDDFLAMAFSLLDGSSMPPSKREEQSRAAQMRCIINDTIKPVRPFKNWSMCIAYLQSAVVILK